MLCGHLVRRKEKKKAEYTIIEILVNHKKKDLENDVI